MATGAGETEVMALAIGWSYLNRTFLSSQESDRRKSCREGRG